MATYTLSTKITLSLSILIDQMNYMERHVIMQTKKPHKKTHSMAQNEVMKTIRYDEIVYFSQ